MSKSEIQQIPITQLSFDPQNPRLLGDIDGQSESAVIDWMLDDNSLIELMGSIAEHGYFPGEPLLVIKNKRKSDSYIVVEGNRRLAAAKLLANPSLATRKKLAVAEIAKSAKHKTTQLPVLIYPQRKDILEYLGYRHVTGVKSWDPLAKAKYLKQLEQSIKGNTSNAEEKYRRISKSIGSRADYVAKMLTGLAIYDRIAERDFYDIKNIDEDSIDFTLLTTALSYNGILGFLGIKSANDPSLNGINDDHLKELTQWLFSHSNEGRTRIGESRNLKQLNRIVSKSKALEAFRKGESLENADMLTEAPSQVFRESIFESKHSLETAREYVHMINDLVHSDEETLEEILGIVRVIRAAVHDKITNNDEQ